MSLAAIKDIKRRETDQFFFNAKQQFALLPHTNVTTAAEKKQHARAPQSSILVKWSKPSPNNDVFPPKIPHQSNKISLTKRKYGERMRWTGAFDCVALNAPMYGTFLVFFALDKWPDLNGHFYFFTCRHLTNSYDITLNTKWNKFNRKLRKKNYCFGHKNERTLRRQVQAKRKYVQMTFGSWVDVWMAVLPTVRRWISTASLCCGEYCVSNGCAHSSLFVATT